MQLLLPRVNFKVIYEIENNVMLMCFKKKKYSPKKVSRVQKFAKWLEETFADFANLLFSDFSQVNLRLK